MLRFQPQYLRQTLIDNSDKALMEFCCLCYYDLKKAARNSSKINEERSNSAIAQPWFLLRTMSELALIFKDKSESPILKFKSTKMIIYLLLMNEPQIYKKFQLELFPLIKNICYYNKSLRIQERGYDFFKKNKYFDVANVQERQKIKLLGAKFVIFCLEIVYMMNKWIPLEAGNRKQLTLYGKSYEQLLKQSVRFPQEEDFMFFNQQKVGQIIKNVQKCQSMVKDNKFSIHSTKLVKYNAVNRSDLSSQGIESGFSQMPSALQKQLNQKQSVIKQFRQNLEQLRQEKIFLIKQFQEEKQTYKNKMTQYQTQLEKLYYEVKYLRKKVKKYQNGNNKNTFAENAGLQSDISLFNSSMSSERSDIVDLKDKIRLLIQQNMKLRAENIQLESKVEGAQSQNFKQSRKQLNIINMNKRQLMEQLLKNDCQQNKQFEPKAQKIKQQFNMLNKLKKKNQIFNAASFLPLQKNLLKKVKSQQYIQGVSKKQISEDLNSPLLIFQPFYSALNDQLRTRLKKSMLKKKQILYKDNFLQIGVKSQIIDEISFKLDVLLTNISNQRFRVKNLRNLSIQFGNRNSQSELIMQILTKNPSLQGGDKKRKFQFQVFNYYKLIPQEQQKIELRFEINNINFSKGILLKVKYEKQFQIKKQKQNSLNKYGEISQMQQEVHFGLILPVCKLKLMKILSKVAKPLLWDRKQKKQQFQKQNILIKLFHLNKKVVQSLKRLIKHFGQEFVHINSNRNNHNQKQGLNINFDKNKQQEISIRISYLDKTFVINFSYVNQYNLEQKSSIINNLYKNNHKQLQSSISNNIQGDINNAQEQLNRVKHPLLVKMIIHYSKSTSYVLADHLANQFLFILALQKGK